MPDPANPRGTNPEAIAARNALVGGDDETKRQAAMKLLRLVLGNNQHETRIEPPLPKWFEDPALIERGRADLPAQRITGRPLDLSTLSPEAISAWIVAQDSRPRAVNAVAATSPLTDGDPGWEGIYHPAFRSIQLRENGGPRSVSDLAETLYHELSHAVHVPDDVSHMFDEGGSRQVNAYDVGSAARQIHSDINLPASKQAIEARTREAQLALLRKK